MNKIIFIISDLDGGGAQRVLSLLSNSLVKKKYEVTIVTLNNSKSFFKIDKKIKVESLNLAFRSKNLFIGFFSNIYRIIKLRELLKKKRTDVVVSFIFQTNIISIISLLFLKKRLIISERNNPFYQKGNFLWGNLRKLFYFFSDVIVVNNNFAYEYFSLHYKKKVKIINNPVDIPKISLEKEKSILVVSRLHQQKSIHLILIAFSRLIHTHRDWSLKIIGVGHLEVSLKILCKNLKITKNVEWLGEKKNIQKYFAKSQIFCLPSLYEGSSNALLEALSHKMSCIVSSTAISEKESHFKFVSTFRSNDENNLYEKLLLSVNAYKKSYSKFDFIKFARKEYSIDKITSEWFKLFND